MGFVVVRYFVAEDFVEEQLHGVLVVGFVVVLFLLVVGFVEDEQVENFVVGFVEELKHHFVVLGVVDFFFPFGPPWFGCCWFGCCPPACCPPWFGLG